MISSTNTIQRTAGDRQQCPLDGGSAVATLWRRLGCGISARTSGSVAMHRVRRDLAVESNRHLEKSCEASCLYHRVACGGKGYSVNGGRVCRDTPEKRGLFNNPCGAAAKPHACSRQKTRVQPRTFIDPTEARDTDIVVWLVMLAGVRSLLGRILIDLYMEPDNA